MTKDIDISIAKVVENRRRSGLHRWEMMRFDDDAPVDISLSASFRTVSSRELTLQLSVHYSWMRGMVRRPLLDYCADFTFEVSNLGHVMALADGEVLLPRELLVTMMNVGIGALRGMMALRTEGTVLEARPLPLLDLRQLVGGMRASDPAGAGQFPSVTLRARG